MSYEVDSQGKEMFTEANPALVKLAGSDVAVPVDIQYSALKAQSDVIIWNYGIRDIVNFYPATNLDWSNHRKIMLRVGNTHDQPVTITFNHQDNGDYLDITGNPISITIPANKSEILVTSKDLILLEQPIVDILALRVKCATAPTVGGLTIVAQYFTY